MDNASDNWYRKRMIEIQRDRHGRIRAMNRTILIKALWWIKRLIWVVCCLCALSLLLTGFFTRKPSVFGFRPFYVMTGSMESTIRAHSLIIAVPVRAEDVRVGDIVTYTRTASDKRFDRIHIPLTVVHRVVAVDGESFIFKGDNEERSDPPVNAGQIGYRLVWIAP